MDEAVEILRGADLRLKGGGGLRFLPRSNRGRALGGYACNAQTALTAAPLVLKFTADFAWPF